MGIAVCVGTPERFGRGIVRKIVATAAFLMAVGVLTTHATASECVPASFSTQVWFCETAQARQNMVAKLAVQLSVEPSDMEPLDYYKTVVYDWSRSIKLTPLFFPGRPPHDHTRAVPTKRSMSVSERRQVTLKNGYLFTDDRKTALSWHRTLRLSDLFDEPRLVVTRGDTRMVLNRQGKDYVHADGPYAGSKAKILLFDRVATDEQILQGASAFDLDAPRVAAGIRRMDILHYDSWALDVRVHLVDSSSILGTVFFTGQQTSILLDTGGKGPADLDARCKTNAQIMAMERGILQQTAIMEAEHLRFDEPYQEIGQQDGALRRAWTKAYRQRKTQFEFNNVSYDVFDKLGRPNVPQVCVDFLVDAIDRSAGTWYRPRGDTPGRTTGWLTLRESMDNVDLRMVRNFVRKAHDLPDMWEVYDVPKEDRFPFRQRDQFYRHVHNFPKTLHEADIFVIWGLRSDNRNHYHSMFIYSTDAVFGMPVLFSDQAGYVRVRVLDEVMRAAPRRYILHWLRLKPEWLVKKRALALPDP
ncbi:MAG: hypothetical protein HUU55_22465 [Myxococcales bacterium]|nr:hypothetical protein [Myxococcales bacterium]